MKKSAIKYALSMLCLLASLPILSIATESGSSSSLWGFLILGFVIVLIILIRISVDEEFGSPNSSDQHASGNNPHPPKPRNEVNSQQSKATPLFTPNPIDKSLTPPDYIRIAISNQVTPHYIPQYLWECVDVLEYTTGYYLPIYSKAYIWAAYFYVFAKTVRSQSIVYELYSKLHEDAMAYFRGRTAGIEPYINLANSYKRIAPALNASGIDPRTADGRNQLWEFLCQWVYFPNNCVDVGRKKFCRDCITIRYFVRELYGVDYPAPSLQYSLSTSTDPEIPTK